MMRWIDDGGGERFEIGGDEFSLFLFSRRGWPKEV
jgi:hypothetical protein